MLNQIKTQAEYDIALELVYKLMQKTLLQILKNRRN